MTGNRTIMPFPAASNTAARRALPKRLVSALRASESRVFLDLTGRNRLDRDDIDILLSCVGQAAGRDTELVLVAGSRVIRLLLDVTRISSLVTVLDSIEDAFASMPIPVAGVTQDIRAVQFSQPRSA